MKLTPAQLQRAQELQKGLQRFGTGNLNPNLTVLINQFAIIVHRLCMENLGDWPFTDIRLGCPEAEQEALLISCWIDPSQEPLVFCAMLQTEPYRVQLDTTRPGPVPSLRNLHTTFQSEPEMEQVAERIVTELKYAQDRLVADPAGT